MLASLVHRLGRFNAPWSEVVREKGCEKLLPARATSVNARILLRGVPGTLYHKLRCFETYMDVALDFNIRCI